MHRGGGIDTTKAPMPAAVTMLARLADDVPARPAAEFQAVLVPIVGRLRELYRDQQRQYQIFDRTADAEREQLEYELRDGFFHAALANRVDLLELLALADACEPYLVGTDLLDAYRTRAGVDAQKELARIIRARQYGLEYAPKGTVYDEAPPSQRGGQYTAPPSPEAAATFAESMVAKITARSAFIDDESN